MTNSRQRARRRHALTPTLSPIHLFFHSVWMQPGTNLSTPKGYILSKANKLHATTTETPWVCIRARGREYGCTMDPIRVVHLCSSITISEGGAWGHPSFRLYDETHAGSPRRALLAAPRREWPVSTAYISDRAKQYMYV